MDTNGNDIVDGATTIWDSSNGYIPEAQLQTANLVWSDLGIAKTDVSKSDVDLGNVENIALSSATWADIGISESDVTKSDVGLGNVENEAQVAESGDSIDGLAINQDTNLVLDGGSWILGDGGGWSDSNPEDDSVSTNAINMDDGGGAIFLTEDVTTNDGCSISNDDDWSCTGSKSWIHSINSTHDAYYYSQESPQVRAVYEGKVDVDGETRVDLPSHFSMTVSDSEPKLRATATVQGELAYAAVIEKTDDYVVLDSSEPSTVNYRITGVREGYEDKQVVRPKEE